MKEFKIWCETNEIREQVLEKMEQNDILWGCGSKPTKSSAAYDAPIGLYVSGRKSLTQSANRELFEEDDSKEISSKDYLEFTKYDLKYGYMVVLRNECKGIYMPTSKGDYFNFVDDYCSICIDSYKDDLTISSCTNHDVMRVYGYSQFGEETCTTITEYRELLWERKEPKVKELTKKEAIELLKEKFKDFDEIKIV